METTKTIKCKEVIAYKGMEFDMTCRDFQYEVGKTYKTDKAELCNCGFHACLNPKDVFEYYSEERKSRYFKVKLSGEITKCGKYYTEVAATEITILEEINIDEIIETTEWWKNDNVLDLLYYSDGFARVQRGDDKYNLIDKNGHYLSKEWFDWAENFQEGFAIVNRGGGKWSFIDKNGNYLSNDRFVWVGDFQEGFASVKRGDGKWNFINKKGNYLSNEWFEWVNNFHEGFARVKRGDELYNFINRQGKILSDEWFDWVDDFQDGFATVQRTNDRLYNFINKDGKILSDEWFKWVGNSDEYDLAIVERTNGELCKITKNSIIVKFLKKTETEMEEKIKQFEDIDTLKELNKNLISENERLAKKNMKLSEKYQSTHKKNASLRTTISSIKGFENAEQLCAELNRLKQQNKSLSEANAKLIADAKVYLETIDEQKKVISASEKSIGAINDKLKIITLSQQSMHQALKDSGDEKSELVKKYKEALSAKSVAEARQEEFVKENLQLKDENIHLREHMIKFYYKASLIQRIKYVFTKSI